MKYASFFIAGLFFLTLFAAPAEAKRFRLFAIPGFGGGETIELVYDLPNEAPFIRDGKPYDVGYLKSRKGNAYVLYHSDRYVKLEDREIALLTMMLGFDPTAQHRAQHAPRERSDAAKPQVEAQQSLPAQAAANRPRQNESGGTPLWVTLAPIFAFVAILFVLIRKGLRGLARLVRSAVSGAAGKDEAMTAAYASLDARVAERLSQLQPDIAPQIFAPQVHAPQVPVPPAYAPQIHAPQAHAPQAYGGHGFGQFAAASSVRTSAPVRSFGRRNA
jgi:hypothetical protein